MITYVFEDVTLSLCSFSVACRYEHFFGPLATRHLCVTNAMKDDLRDNWGIRWASAFISSHQS